MCRSNSIEVEVEAFIDPRALSAGHEATPVYPQNISTVVHIDSPAAAADIQRLRDAVETACPILNLLKNPQSIASRVDHRSSRRAAAE